jgi:hypothetical protein
LRKCSAINKLIIPLIITISWICSITFLWSKMCFIYFYLPFEKYYWLFKVYLLEFDIRRLGKTWIQQWRLESKTFEHLWNILSERVNM